MSCSTVRPVAEKAASRSPRTTRRSTEKRTLVLLSLLSMQSQSYTQAYMVDKLSGRQFLVPLYSPLFSVSSKSIRANGGSSETVLPSRPSVLLEPSSPVNCDRRRATPKHVAFVCDGNSRWAAARNLPSAAGHAAGAERLVQVLRSLQATTVVTHCTMYGFSTENWKRPEREIREIFMAMEQTARSLYNSILRDDVIIKVIGDLSDERIPTGLREILQQLEQMTLKKYADNPKDNVLTLCLAINYGGRRDIVNASKRLAARIADGTLDPESVSEEIFADCLDTTGVPDPDLLIRTSGENRLSNFMLWNAAYAELYFTETLWPDFDAHSVQAALDWYANRRRRFGAREESSFCEQ